MRPANTYTPELMANGQYRYEETDEPVTSIAADFEVHTQTFHKYITKWGWRRRSDRPPRDLSPALRALAEVEAAPALVPEAAADVEVAPHPDPAPRIERVLAAVDKELAAVERMRAHLGDAAQEPVDSERTARTLATLARTLREVQRLSGGGLTSLERNDDDDMPTDIDEFRYELARRIHAFVDARTAKPVDDDRDDGSDGSDGAA